MSSGAKDSIRQPLHHGIYQLCCLVAAKLGPCTGPRYRAKCPWQVRILLQRQQVKKHVTALEIVYHNFPIMLVSKTNEGMKTKQNKKHTKKTVGKGVFCGFWMVQGFQ